MGLNMVKNLLDHNHQVVAWNRSPEPRKKAEKYGAITVENIKDIPKKSLEIKLSDNKDDSKVVIFSMISAGPIVDKILFENNENSIINVLKKGDIFIDGVNSHYKDSVRRAVELNKYGIKMLDAGISGGVDGARNGACAMVGGDKEAFEYVEQIFKDITVENGYGYFGESGAGHHVKMVHNAIEYGMMQVIGEGLNLIENSNYKVDYNKVLDVWNNGSIIESKLVGFLQSAMKKTEDIDKLDTEVGALGTGMWASIDALERGVPFTGITHAVFNRYMSRKDGDFAFKMIQAMRSEFGSHNSKERESFYNS